MRLQQRYPAGLLVQHAIQCVAEPAKNTAHNTSLVAVVYAHLLVFQFFSARFTFSAASGNY
jgi:hypothetical protein